MVTQIKLYAEIPSTHVLGFGTRYAIWFQGCPFHCVNCMTPGALNPEDGYLVSIEELSERILNTPDIEGVTISGGEPFSQSTQLCSLLLYLRKKRDLGVIVYSGYRLSHLKKKATADPIITKLLAEIDILVDGLYVQKLNDDNAMRGSSNQQILHLSKRYITNKLPEKREVEMHVMNDKVMIVGVPSASLLAIWKMWN